MKKIVLMLALFLGAASMYAQTRAKDITSVVFVDSLGNTVADGFTVTCSETKSDEFGEFQIPVPLYVKNVAGVGKHVRAVLEVKQISNGTTSVCTFITCLPPSPETGKFYSPTDKEGKTQAFGLKPDEQRPFLTEWFPVEGQYGTCQATFHLEFYTYSKDKGYTYSMDGPEVTINFVYSDPTAIEGVGTDSSVKRSEWFDLSGRRVAKPVSGVYVERSTLADGTVKTVKKVVK